jgi:hypothetical protein
MKKQRFREHYMKTSMQKPNLRATFVSYLTKSKVAHGKTVNLRGNFDRVQISTVLN